MPLTWHQRTLDNKFGWCSHTAQGRISTSLIAHSHYYLKGDIAYMHVKLDLLTEKGYAILKDYDGPPIPKEERMALEYMDCKSGGDTNFAPIASAFGDMEFHGFSVHGKPSNDGVSPAN